VGLRSNATRKTCACQVIREILAEPTRQVVVDSCEVPLEDRCEALGLA
jgi:hypothetical protein